VEITINLQKTVEELHIHRAKTAKNGNHTYHIIKPEGFSDIEIKHHYDKGAFDLVLKVMKILKKNGYNAQPTMKWAELKDLYG
jgi:hypothetical protein